MSTYSMSRLAHQVAAATVLACTTLFSLNALALRDLPDVQKYPKELREAAWDNNKGVAVKLIGKTTNVKGLGTAMKNAEEAMAGVIPAKYQIAQKDLVKLDEIKIHQIFAANQIVWAGAQKKLLEGMDEINTLAKDYQKAIANSKLSATVSEKFNTYLAKVVSESESYKQQIEVLQAAELFEILEERALSARDMVSGKKDILKLKEHLATILSLQGKVKTLAKWKEEQVDTRYIRGSFIQANKLKERVGDTLVGQWRDSGLDSWQPTSDEMVVEKFTVLKKMVEDTNEALDR